MIVKKMVKNSIFYHTIKINSGQALMALVMLWELRGDLRRSEKGALNLVKSSSCII